MSKFGVRSNSKGEFGFRKSECYIEVGVRSSII